MATALSAIQKLGREIQEKRDGLKALFKTDADGNYTMSAEECTEIQKREDELAPLVSKWEEQRKLYEKEKRNEEGRHLINQPLGEMLPYEAGNDGDSERGEIRQGKLRSLGQWARGKLEEFKFDGSKGNSFQRIDIDCRDELQYRAVMTTSAGFAPANDRSNLIVYSAQRRPVVQDLIPVIPYSGNLYKYMEETTFTNTAAPTAENATKPEAALAYTEQNQVIETVAVYIQLTEQQLADVQIIAAIVDNRLRLMNAQAEENQVVNGDGSTPNLRGFLNKAGLGSIAKGTDAIPDAILKAMVNVATVGRAQASGIVMNPADMQAIRLLKTADGVYIYGSPAERGPQTLWGLPVVETTVIAAGTALLGDFPGYSEIIRRMGVTIDVGWINDDFIKNRRAVRCESRLALVITRAAAFCKVTGLAA